MYCTVADPGGAIWGNVANTFFSTVHLLSKDLRFEHGGAKLALGSPWAPPNLLRPGAFRGQMAPGARTKFGAPIFESEVLWKQIYCIEGIFVTLLEIFGAHRSHSAPP